MDCKKANRLLWSIVQIFISINVDMQWGGETEAAVCAWQPQSHAVCYQVLSAEVHFSISVRDSRQFTPQFLDILLGFQLLVVSLVFRFLGFFKGKYFGEIKSG